MTLTPICWTSDPITLSEKLIKVSREMPILAIYQTADQEVVPEKLEEKQYSAEYIELL